MNAYTKLVIKKALMDASILFAIAIPLGVSALYLTNTIQVNALLSVAVTLLMYFLLFAVAEPLKKTSKSDFDSITQDKHIDSELARQFVQSKSKGTHYDSYEVLDLLQVDRFTKTLTSH